MSMPVDSGCTNSIFSSAVSFMLSRPSQMTVVSANGGVTPVSVEGISCMVLLEPSGLSHEVELPGSIVAKGMTKLLSVNALREAGVGTHFPPRSMPYVELASGARIPLRLGKDRLWYLDFLQPSRSAAATAAPAQTRSAARQLGAAPLTTPPTALPSGLDRPQCASQPALAPVTSLPTAAPTLAPTPVLCADPGVPDLVATQALLSLVPDLVPEADGEGAAPLADPSVPVCVDPPRLPEVGLGDCLWYRRFGHPGKKRMEATVLLVRGIKGAVHYPTFDPCRAMGRSTQHPRNTKPARRAQADVRLGQVSIDLHGPYKVPGLHGEQHVVVFIDGFSWYSYAVPVVHASLKTVLAALRMFIRDVGRPGSVLTDWGSEFAGLLEQYCADHDIQMLKSCPHEHWQAGLIEHSNQTLKEVARTLLQDSQLLACFWSYVITTTSYLNNRLATRSLDGVTPYERFYGAKPENVNGSSPGAAEDFNGSILTAELAIVGFVTMWEYGGECNRSPRRVKSAKQLELPGPMPIFPNTPPHRSRGQIQNIYSLLTVQLRIVSSPSRAGTSHHPLQSQHTEPLFKISVHQRFPSQL